MSSDDSASGSEGRALVKFLLENRMMMNWISILMIVYAVWATIEVLTNASGATWWPPETGTPVSDYFESDNSTQNINNGWVIGLGAVFGTIGSMVQYFYRAAPYVDASMQATAALIISAVKEDEIQESAEKIAKEMVAAEKEEAEAEAQAEAQVEAAAALESEQETTAEPTASADVVEDDGQRKKF